MSKDVQPKSTAVYLKFAPQPSSNEERPNDPQVIDHSGHPQPMAFSGRLKRSMRVRLSHPPRRFFDNTTDPCSPETLVASIRALSGPDGDSLPSIRIGNPSLTLPRTDRRECFLYCPNVAFTVLLGAKRADTATITRGLPSFRKIGPVRALRRAPSIDSRFQAGRGSWNRDRVLPPHWLVLRAPHDCTNPYRPDPTSSR